VGARQARFLAAIAGGLALMVVAFFVTARYRVTIVPFLLIFAAYGVQWFARQAGRRARLIAAVSVAGLFLLANVGQDPMETRMNADAEYALAMRVGNRGRLQQAAVLFESAVASRPDYAEAWLNLCASYHRLGRPQDAQTAMDRALTADLPGTLEAMRAFADSGDPTLVGPLGAYLRESAARRLRNAAQAPQATPPSKDR
jgi:tetratricopeptide (TPR) repeat protein